MKELLIRGHLGLGDHLVTNALVRHYADRARVTVLAKEHNVPAVAFMFRDNVNIEVVSVESGPNADNEADEYVKLVQDNGKKTLCLGNYGTKPFESRLWDKGMYLQACVDFKDRWNNFKVDRQPSREIEVPKGKYIFVHDDASRGYAIDEDKLPKKKIVRPDREKTDNIFDWWGIIEEAEEIHCIDSSFAILVDSLPCLKAKRFVLHLYARPEGLPPSYIKGWERLK